MPAQAGAIASATRNLRSDPLRPRFHSDLRGERWVGSVGEQVGEGSSENRGGTTTTLEGTLLPRADRVSVKGESATVGSLRGIERASSGQDDAILAALDERTREIIQSRRSSAIKRRGWLIRRLLLLADVVGLSVAFLLSEFALEPGAADRRFEHFILFAVFLPLWVIAAKLHGLYDRDEERADYSTTDDVAGVFVLVTIISWLYVAATIALNMAVPDLVRLTVFWGTAVPLIALGRVAVRAQARRHPVYIQNTLIVGAGEVGQLIAWKCLRHPEYGINVVGFLDSEPKERREGLDHLTVLGTSDQLRDVVRCCEIERVVVAFSTETDQQALGLVRSIDDLDVQIDVVPRLFEMVGSAVDVHSVEGLPLIGLRPPHLSRSSMMLKRSFDLALATIGLILLAPLMAVVAGAIKLDTRGQVLFRQLRMGTRGQPFYIYKFRTMISDADSKKHEVVVLNKHARVGGDPRMFKALDDPRVTRVGKFLRRYSLDELPQMINVLKGDMSLVGPRPLILEEDRHVQDWARKRLDIKPGITGPWQVLGRSEIPFGEMVRLDYNYVTRWSLYGDLKLILRTLPAMVREREAY